MVNDNNIRDLKKIADSLTSNIHDDVIKYYEIYKIMSLSSDFKKNILSTGGIIVDFKQKNSDSNTNTYEIFLEDGNSFKIDNYTSVIMLNLPKKMLCAFRIPSDCFMVTYVITEHYVYIFVCKNV